MNSAWGIDESENEGREEKPVKPLWLTGSLPLAQIYGMTCSEIGSMGPKMQNESRRLAENLRTEINRFGDNANDNSKKGFFKTVQSKKSKEGRDPLGPVMQC